MTIIIKTDSNAAAHDECFPPDYPRVHCSINRESYIEVTRGDANDKSDPPEIEVREFDGFGEATIARIRPTRDGLASLIQSLLAELQRMNGL